MDTMMFSTTDLRNKALHQTHHFDDFVDVSGLADAPENDIIKIDPVHVKGFCTIDGDEIIFSYIIEGEMILPCARTLAEVPYAFSMDATDVFSLSGQLDKTDKENDVHPILGEMIDLSPYIKENIILKMPYRVFSDEKAIEQGEGWNLRQEDEKHSAGEKTIDPRLAKLGQLLDQNKDSKE